MRHISFIYLTTNLTQIKKKVALQSILKQHMRQNITEQEEALV